MATFCKPPLVSRLHSATWGVLLAGGILFVIGFGGSGVLTGGGGAHSVDVRRA